MIPYKIRSLPLINLVREIRNETLIPQAYFQRNLVWREVHKKELIRTISLGFPFPMIFISKGEIDIEKMSTTSCIIDGQQRCDAITSFVDNDFSVDGKYFRDFTEDEKNDFFKYEIPVCDIDILNNDPQVLEMFKRINRTSNSLTNIEKKASEYGTSYLMLVAKLISKHIDINNFEDDKENFLIDPNIPESFVNWAKIVDTSNISRLLTSENIFSPIDIARKVNLQYTLNLIATYIDGFYNRNDKVDENLDLYVDEFDLKDQMIINFEEVAKIYLNLNLLKDSMWFNKANFFTLFTFISNLLNRNIDIDIEIFANRLNQFEPNDEYRIAAKEGVNNLKERRIRNEHLELHFSDLLFTNE